MAHTITLIPGDGIGPEVTEAVVRIFKVAGLQIEWERHDAGVTAFKRFNQSLPVELLDSIRKNKVALKGPVTTPIAEGFTSVNVGLRKALDLYANLRPVKNLEGVASRFQGVDLVIVRENTEDLYSGLEHEVIPGVVESLKIITEKASTRIAKFAFEHARGNGRKRVTAIHKANILKLGDGLFLRSIRDVAREYTDIGYDEKIIDAACMSLVMTPEKFDVLVLPNLYGDIVSDLGAGLVGGLGVVPGREHRRDLRGLRSRPWQRAGHRRQEPRESDRPAAVGADDARPHRRTRARRPHPRRPRPNALCGQGEDARSWRAGVDDGVHRRDLQGDRELALFTAQSFSPRRAQSTQNHWLVSLRSLRSLR